MCTANTAIVNDWDYEGLWQLYAGNWSNPELHHIDPQTNENILPHDSAGNVPGSTTYAKFTTEVSRPLGNVDGAMSFLSDRYYLNCTPAPTLYTLIVTYLDSVRSVFVTTGCPRVLTNIASPVNIYTCLNTCNCCYEDSCSCRSAPQWNESALAWFHDVQLMGLTDTVTSNLAGGYHVDVTTNFTTSKFNVTIDWDGENKTVTIDPSDISDSLFTAGGAQRGPLNNTIIAATRINRDFQAFKDTVLDFDITKAILNDMLINVTLSLLNTLNLWNNTTTATKSELTNVFAFSRPANLIVPYCASLLIGLIFLLLGSISLRRNGVAAEGNSFVQLLITLTGSTALAREAAAGCMVGGQAIPQRLRDLKIQFGELLDLREKDGSGEVRRAGFGLPGEVGEIDRRARYGSAG